MINLDNNSELHKNYEKSLSFLKNIDLDNYNYPDKVTNFHIYSEIKNEKELLCIKSWIATQNLEKCKLHVWSDYDISDNHLIKPYMDFIELRIYNPFEEAKGTILENKIEHLNANDYKYWLKSDLFRILILHKYGGIFVDHDIVFLRDFKPLLDQEFVYQWGSELDYEKEGACATVISAFNNSEFTNHLINELSRSRIQLGASAIWGRELLAKVYKYYKYTIFPSSFFNVEWQMNTMWINGIRNYNPDGLGTQTEKGWFVKNEKSGDLYLETFTWHWHNSSFKDQTGQPPVAEDGSKFWNLNELMSDKLNEKIKKVEI
jgi:hypothetical protein